MQWLGDSQADTKSRTLGDRQLRHSRMTIVYQSLREEIYLMSLMTELTLALTNA